MAFARKWAGWLSLAAGVLCVTSVRAQATRETADASHDAATVRAGLFHHRSAEVESAAARIPLEDIPAPMRDSVNVVLEKPTVFTHGPKEAFTCSPTMYQWLLDNPDQAVRLWRRIGARCMDIQNRGQGIFGWKDGQGSDVRWWTIYRGSHMRIWYAEGNAKATGVLPLVPVRAVVVLHHVEGRNSGGHPMIQHQVDMFLHTDSKSAALVARLMGASAPRMAEQCAGQLEMFFSALAWYLDQHPAKAETVLSGILPEDAPQWQELRKRSQSSPSTENNSPSSEHDPGT